jgi:hypothetical protein
MIEFAAEIRTAMSLEDYLQPGEEIVYRAHPTRIALLVPGAVAAVAAAATLFAWSTTEHPLVPLLGGAVVIAALGVVLVRSLLLATNEYVLTNRRLIKQTGVVAKRSMDAYLDKINNVEHRQTAFGRLLGYGDVEVDTASETGTTVFPRVAAPLEFKRAILASADAWRGRGGAAVAGSQPLSGAERLRQLKALLDDGLIDENEFEAKRRQLVAEL